MTPCVEGNVLVDACRLDPFSDNSIDLCVVGHMIEDKTFLSDSTEYLHRFITKYLWYEIIGLSLFSCVWCGFAL